MATKCAPEEKKEMGSGMKKPMPASPRGSAKAALRNTIVKMYSSMKKKSVK